MMQGNIFPLWLVWFFERILIIGIYLNTYMYVRIYVMFFHWWHQCWRVLNTNVEGDERETRVTSFKLSLLNFYQIVMKCLEVVRNFMNIYIYTYIHTYVHIHICIYHIPRRWTVFYVQLVPQSRNILHYSPSSKGRWRPVLFLLLKNFFFIKPPCKTKA